MSGAVGVLFMVHSVFVNNTKGRLTLATSSLISQNRRICLCACINTDLRRHVSDQVVCVTRGGIPASGLGRCLFAPFRVRHIVGRIGPSVTVS